MSPDDQRSDLAAAIVYRRQFLGRWLQAEWEHRWFKVFQTRVAVIGFIASSTASVGDFFGFWPLADELDLTFKIIAFGTAVMGGIGFARNVWDRLQPRSEY